MRQTTVTLEIKNEAPDGGAMRWERGASGDAAAFDLLGRAFDIAHRECGEDFSAALRAFFKAARIQKGDVADLLETME